MDEAVKAELARLRDEDNRQNHRIDDLEQFIVDNEVQIAALTIPKSKAPEIAERLVKAGIKAIWNFAHLDLDVPDSVQVENVHLSDSLMKLSYNIRNSSGS